MKRTNVLRLSRVLVVLISALVLFLGCGIGTSPPKTVDGVEIAGPAAVFDYCKGMAPDIELTAMTELEDGSFVWTIEKGSDLVTIVGSKEKQTLRIRSKSRSLDPEDVTIKVVYTSRSGIPFEDTHKLTVQHPTKAEHAPLVHHYEELDIGLGNTILAVVTAETFEVTVTDQFGAPMVGLHVDEFVTASRDSIARISVSHLDRGTGEGDTDENGVFLDQYYVPSVGEMSTVGIAILNQTLIFGENQGNCCSALNVIKATRTSIADDYPISIP